MKNLIIFFMSLLMGVSLLSAQDNTPMVDTVMYVTPAEEAFMIDKETTSLFKFSSASTSLVNIFENRQFSLAFEQKLSPSFSITPILDISLTQIGEFDLTRINFGGELRYYYKLKELISKFKQANNVSSNYFAINYSNNIYAGSFNNGPDNYIGFSYGIQKRFLNYGFLDYRATLSRSAYPTNGAQLFSLSTGFNVGIGIGKNYDVKQESKCPIFKCYTNRKSALKINLNNSSGITVIENPGLAEARWYIYLRPNIIYEQKIANSPLSVENDLSFSITFGNIGIFNAFDVSYSLTNRLGLKYYLNQTRNIKNGKSGNNLSGQYIFGRTQFFHGKFTQFVSSGPGEPITVESITQEGFDVQAGFGIQKEVLEKLFFDVNLGFSKRVRDNINGTNDKIQLISDIKVGLMF